MTQHRKIIDALLASCIQEAAAAPANAHNIVCELMEALTYGVARLSVAGDPSDALLHGAMTSIEEAYDEQRAQLHAYLARRGFTAPCVVAAAQPQARTDH